MVGISFNYYDCFRVIVSECCSELDQDRTFSLVARMRVIYVLGVVMAICIVCFEFLCEVGLYVLEIYKSECLSVIWDQPLREKIPRRPGEVSTK